MQRISNRLALLLLALLLGGASQLAAQQKPAVTHTATMVTSMGTIEMELYGVDAPKTVNNFVGLAGRKFFEGILFHRVVPGFVIQAGDPKTKNPALKSEWGTGGESIYDNQPFADEVNPASPSRQLGYVEGVLAMANSGPNTNQSQFFIVLNNDGARQLINYNTYTIFGRVTRGMDVVQKIAQGQIADPSRGLPASPVSITRVTTSAVVGGGAASSQQRTPTKETAQQFWKRFQAAVKKGKKDEVADAFLFGNAVAVWKECSGTLNPTREQFLACYKQLFTSYVVKQIGKAKLNAEQSLECNPAYRGSGFTASFMCAPTTHDRQGTEFGCGVMFSMTQIDGQWKIICSAIAG